MKKKTNKYCDLIFTFNYVCVDFSVNEDFYSTEDCKKIKNILQIITEEIVIDKSYVEFSENKHEDVFMTEFGWNELCKLTIDTKKNATKKQNITKLEAYMLMILSYIYLFFENLGYNTDEIYFEIAKDSRFMTTFCKDTIQEWKYYPGKWQTWKSYKDK